MNRASLAKQCAKSLGVVGVDLPKLNVRVARLAGFDFVERAPSGKYCCATLRGRYCCCQTNTRGAPNDYYIHAVHYQSDLQDYVASVYLPLPRLYQ